MAMESDRQIRVEVQADAFRMAIAKVIAQDYIGRWLAGELPSSQANWKGLEEC